MLTNLVMALEIHNTINVVTHNSFYKCTQLIFYPRVNQVNVDLTH